MEERLQQALDRRRAEGSLRALKSIPELEKESVDFSSNDYLGLAACPRQLSRVEKRFHAVRNTCQKQLGATGSRLLSGDSVYCRELEEWLARLHNRPAALIANSGYDANLSVTSCLPVDVIVMDELCHNSIVMGVRWNKREHDTIIERFKHNNVEHLKVILQSIAVGRVVLVIVESVYSMDGDVAPLQEILDISRTFGAQVVVDEAHGLGIYGRTNREDLSVEHSNDKNEVAIGGTGVLAALELESHPALLCSVHTFGKAAGCHGAVLCCSSPRLFDYLLNYARPFIYSTALPLHSLITIKCAYETMIGSDGKERRQQVFRLVRLFQRQSKNMDIQLYPSNSPIQALLMSGNNVCVDFCAQMRQHHSIILFPIRAPTVPPGQERVRIILHANNTPSQVMRLVECIGKTLWDMGLVKKRSRL
jgi:8-amino-7-oxononanoate synthase